jgi:hypothetical protein
MKKIYILLLSICPIVGFTQNLLLNIDGEQPNPFSDKTGYHTVITHGQPMDSLGFLVFKNETPIPQIHNYLSVDSLYNVFDVNENWTVEFKVYTADAGEDHFFLDWGSTSLTGHMRFAYDEDRGLHFSDRPVNGQSGFIIADSTVLPQNTWVVVKFEKLGSIFNLYRNGVLVKTQTNSSTLTTPTVLTVAYSEDDRPFHNWYLMDDVQIRTNQSLGIQHGNIDNDIKIYAIGDQSLFIANKTSSPLHFKINNMLGQEIERIVVYPNQRLIKKMNVSNQLFLIESQQGNFYKVFIY